MSQINADDDLAFGGLVPDNLNAALHGWLDGDTHYFALIALFEDTDAGGIVYHANYLNYAERARSGWLRLVGVSQAEQLYENKHGFVVRKADISYISPAKLMDEIIVETTLLHASRARMSARQIIRKAEAGKKISDCHIFATVDVEIVMVNEAGRPSRMPPDILAKMQPSS
ncbi:MAG: YbgC/FadM family acyl-CoA thioesterase [Candidatus Puniceispirillaceae bacterium]